jgi:hypothetical protein
MLQSLLGILRIGKTIATKLNTELVYAARKRYWEELPASAARKRC